MINRINLIVSRSKFFKYLGKIYYLINNVIVKLFSNYCDKLLEFTSFLTNQYVIGIMVNREERTADLDITRPNRFLTGMVSLSTAYLCDNLKFHHLSPFSSKIAHGKASSR